MENNKSSEEQIRQLVKRIGTLENLVQGLVQRVYNLETLEKPDRKPALQAPPSSESISASAKPSEMPAVGDITPREDFSPPLPQIPTEGSQYVLNEGGATPSLPGGTQSIFDLRAAQKGFEPKAAAEVADLESLESRIGGNWLNKIGMVAVVLGVVYFLKYAIDNRWIGEMGRVMLGLLAGVGFLSGGEALHRRNYPGYGLTLRGGGIAILYFSIFAAFNFYNLIPQFPAFLLMALITATAVLMSVRYNSRVIAVLGILGGFGTPLMLATGKDNQVALFSYIVLLDLGILALAYSKNWRALNLLAFVFTQLISVAWALSYYTESKLWRTEFFLTIFFLIFAFMAFLYNIIHRQKTVYYDQFLILINGAIYFLWTYSLLQDHYSDYLGFFALLLAMAYAGLAILARRRSPNDQFLILIQLGIALTFITLAIPIQLKQHWITLGWTMEALVLTWVGFRTESDKTRFGALLIVLLVSTRLLFFDTVGWPWHNFTFLLNSRALAFAGTLAVLLAMAWLYWKMRDRCMGHEKHISSALILLANFLFLFFLTTEIHQGYQAQLYQGEPQGEVRMTTDYSFAQAVRSQEQLMISFFWGIYSILLLIIGIMKRYSPVRWLAMLLFAVTILKVFIFDLSELEKVYRIFSFIGLGLILLAASFLYQRFRRQINDLIRP
jgi:uncharacterized membrane protein